MANTKLYHCIAGIWDCNRIIGTPKDLSLHLSSSFILHTAQTISFVGQLSSVTAAFNGNYPTVLESPISYDPYCSFAPPSQFHATALQVFVRNKALIQIVQLQQSCIYHVYNIRTTWKTAASFCCHFVSQTCFFRSNLHLPLCFIGKQCSMALEKQGISSGVISVQTLFSNEFQFSNVGTFLREDKVFYKG